MVATAAGSSPFAAAPPHHAGEAVPQGANDAVWHGLIWAFRRIIGVYFREIEVAGNIPSSDVGGRVFVANHTNGIVDPILILTTAPPRIAPVAKSTLWKTPGLRWLLDQAGAVPITRRRDDPTKAQGANESVFDKIAAAISAKKNILIFPEGTSHNEPKLIEVKSGAARMIARAKEQGARGLTFQSVALEFDERDTFRSRCLLVYGPVRDVDEMGLEGDELVAAITERLRDDLSELLVEGATWPERVLIARVAEMLVNDLGDKSLERWNSIGRQVEAARKALGDADEATVKEVSDVVTRYYERLLEEGLADEQLATGAVPGKTNTVADAALLFSLPLAALGAVLYAPPWHLTRILANKVAKEQDELSTYKLGVGLLAYPAWAAALTAAGFMLTPPPISLGIGAAVVASPFAALAWHDAAPKLRRAVRFASRRNRLEELRALRAEALGRVEAVRVKLGL